MHTYESLVIHGLLQTDEYARALYRAGVPGLAEQLREQRIKVRMERQRLLATDEPLKLWSICSEAALRMVVGNKSTMRNQLKQLLDLAELPHITLQAVPFTSGSHPGMGSPYAVIRFSSVEDPDVVYVEGLIGDVWIEGEDVEQYKIAFDHARAAALNPSRTIDLIAEIRDNLLDA